MKKFWISSLLTVSLLFQTCAGAAAEETVFAEEDKVSAETLFEAEYASGEAVFSGNAEVSGEIVSSGNAEVSGEIVSSGNAEVSGEVVFSGNAEVSGEIVSPGNAEVSGEIVSPENAAASDAEFFLDEDAEFEEWDTMEQSDGQAALGYDEVSGEYSSETEHSPGDDGLFDPESQEFWDDLFEEEETPFEETGEEPDVLAKEGPEEADEPVALEDALVVDPDNTSVSVPAVVGGRRLLKAAQSVSFSGSYGNQLSGMASVLYQKRIAYYADGKGTGDLTISFDKKTTPITFSAELTAEGSLDRGTEAYKAFHEQVRQAMQESGDAFLYDHSEVFWVRSGNYLMTPGKYKDSAGNWIGYLAKIVYTPVASFEGASSLIPAYESAVNAAVSEIRAGADYDGNGQIIPLELAMAAHDYVCENLFYDNAALGRYENYVSLHGSSKEYDDFRIFVSAGAFLESVGNGAVCEGYARAYKVLCDRLGIPCVLIGGKVVQSGKTMGHMWNGVQIDGKWYLLDSTWDDSSSGISHKYFLVGNITSGRTSSGNFSGSPNTRTFVYPVLETEKLVFCENLKHDYDLVQTTASCTETGHSVYVCSRCQMSYETEETLGHSYAKKVTAPTCTEDGYREYTCTRCGESYTEKTAAKALGHSYLKKTTAPTCTAGGYTTYTCSRCGDTYKGDVTKALGHSYKNGVCTRCGVGDSVANASISGIGSYAYTGKAVTPLPTVKFGSNTLKKGTDYTVSYRSNTEVGTASVTVTGKGKYRGSKTVAFKITKKQMSALTCSSVSAMTYTGKALKPDITVKNGTVTLVRDRDYTISYSANKKIGEAVAALKGKGSYTGTKTVTFKIVPQGISLKKVKAAAGKKMKVTWNAPKTKVGKNIDGYQIQYAADKNFTGAKKVKVKVGAVSKTISKLKKGKTYYVRIRTWKKADGAVYYSSWSAVKKVKIKK